MVKPGSMVLFIDNASGGFTELMSKVSKQCNMTNMYGPINHKFFIYEDLKSFLCGYTSCFKTRITLHLLEKQDENVEVVPVLAQAGAEASYVKPSIRLAQSLSVNLNGLVAQGLDTNDYEVIGSKISLKEWNIDQLQSLNVYQPSDTELYESQNTELPNCQNTVLFEPQKEYYFEPQSASVEIDEERKLEVEVSCCSSCVIS